MRLYAFLSLLCVTLGLLAPLAGAEAAAPPRPGLKDNLTLMVDSRMLLPAAQLARAYAKQTNTPLTVVLKNKTTAENQILQGIEAHILLTSDHALVERLTDQGLTDVRSTTVYARAQLALLAAHDLQGKDSFAPRISFAATLLATPDLPILTTPPGTVEGTRTEALRTGYEFSETLNARLRTLPTRDEVFDTMRDEPSLVLMLASDATGKPDVTVLNVLPEEISPPVNYEAVVLASESMEDARQFVQFLQGEEAQKILTHFGFQPVN